MRWLSVIPLSLCTVLCVAASCCSALPVSMDGYHPVKTNHQLWRYQVGREWMEGISLGKEFVCLLSSHGKYLRGIHGRVHNDHGQCKEQERFKIHFLYGNHVRITTFYEGLYITCAEDGHLTLQPELTTRTIFRLYINDQEDKLVIYSPAQQKVASARGSGVVACDKEHVLGDEEFSGWRVGRKDKWETTDEWQQVGSFDNRHSSGSGQLSYSKTVGVEKTTEKTETGVGVSKGLCSLKGLAEFFANEVNSKVHYDWTKATGRTWTQATTITATITIPPGKEISLYQAVGHCGVFTIYTNRFQAREEIEPAEV